MAAPFAAPGAGEAVEGSPASDEVLIRRACGEVSTYRLELRGPTANAFSRRSLVDVLTHTAHDAGLEGGTLQPLVNGAAEIQRRYSGDTAEI